MGANNITALCESAAAAWLKSCELELTEVSLIDAGIAYANSGIRRVTCSCQKAVPEENYEGNWSCTLRIEVSSNADEYSEQDHKDAAAEVFAQFMTDTIVNDLSAALDGFTAQEVWPLEQGYSIQDRKWKSYLELLINCCGSDFA